MSRPEIADLCVLAVTVWITPEEEKFFSGGKLVYFPEFDLYKGQ